MDDESMTLAMWKFQEILLQEILLTDLTKKLMLQEPMEELSGYVDAMDADEPANFQYGCVSLTISGETNQAQKRRPEKIGFFFNIFGSELKSRFHEVEVDREEESHLWFEDTSFMLDESEDAGKELDNFISSSFYE
ncbi:hypothetical protein AgCh_022370 [Apium graveolens]